MTQTRCFWYLLLAISAATPSVAQDVPERTPASEEITSALQLGRLIQAERMLSMARASGAWNNAYQLLQADLVFAKGGYQESYSSYAALLQSEVGAKAALGAGLSALQLNKLDLAEPLLRRASAEPYDQWRAWNGLGVLLDRQGRLEAGEEAFRRGLELRPTSKTLWNNLGYCLILQGKAEAALAAFQQAQGHQAHNDLVRSNLDIAKAMKGVYPTRQSGEASAQWTTRLNNAGYGAWLSGRLDDARSLFARAVLERETHFKLAEHNLRAVEAIKFGKPATP